jgi:predicted MFS family arabinose efflux permease
MLVGRGRLAVLLAATFVGMVGYGAVVPYLYADIAHTRGLGAGVAATVYVLFSAGALLAAPLGGRLADRYNPGTVASIARLLAALSMAGLAVAANAPLVWMTALACGIADAVAQPTSAVILLHWTKERRREAFAWRFTVSNLGLAAGGFLGGRLADLSSTSAMLPVFAVAVAAETVAAVLLWLVTRRPIQHQAAEAPGSQQKPITIRRLIKDRRIALLLAVSTLLSLACYAQYESGLPTYALTALHVSPGDLGTSLAINAAAVALLTTPVTFLVRRANPAVLLGACASIWVGVWLILGLPLAGGASANLCLLTALIVMALGETVMAPVLTPLAASFAPPGATATTVAAVTTAQTVAMLAGPALSGALFALGVPAVFIGFQIACCLGTLVLLPGLARHVAADQLGSRRRGTSPFGPSTGPEPAAVPEVEKAC